MPNASSQQRHYLFISPNIMTRIADPAFGGFLNAVLGGDEWVNVDVTVPRSHSACSLYLVRRDCDHQTEVL